MKIDIITIFPEMFKGPFDESIVKRAQDKKLIEINVHNLRKWTKDKRGTVDDKPYSGGVGMVMMVEPIAKAIEEVKEKDNKTKTVLLCPKGKVFKQEIAQEYVKLDQLILICGHYEGVDERVRNFIDEEISIGDFILTGGEIPAMLITDAVTRLIPKVLKKPQAIIGESFSDPNLLEYPQYTHPEDYAGLKVPPILLSGNHAKIEKWRKEQAIKITKKIRPDLLKEG